MTSPPAVGPLEIFLLGEVPLGDLLRLQQRLVYEQGEGSGGALILCEHPPSISVGRSGSRSHIVADDDALGSMRLPVRWVARGGGCVLHLPGQLAGYLVLSLDAHKLNLGHYLERLEGAIQDVLAEFGLTGRAWSERPGVFLNHARVASLGVAVTRGVTSYGFTLNVGTYLSPFSLLDEPGIEGWPLRQTSMEAQRQRVAPMAKVRESAIRAIEGRFALQRHHVYTDHPLIRPKARPHVHVSGLH
jgi:lipoyl(octanoyl) transferase